MRSSKPHHLLLRKSDPIRLGVNIDHAATLRRVRGNTTEYPDLLALSGECCKGGAEQITIHLREDRRHIQDSDVELLCRKSPLPINLEMAATKEMFRIAARNKPAWICLVPEKRRELTTEGGLDVVKLRNRIRKLMVGLKSLRAPPLLSCFIAPDVRQVKASLDVGAQAVEFHTGTWVSAKGLEKSKEWKRLVEAAQVAYSLGLRVHAGHGLDFVHAVKIRNLPHLVEVNIGHSLICYSLELGMKRAVQIMRKHLRK